MRFWQSKEKPKETGGEKNLKRVVLEWTEILVTALLLALFIRTFVMQAFRIPTGSMIPTLLIGDQVMVNKFIYGTKIPFSDKRILSFKKPEKTDIIVFKYPEDRKRDFIKRIVASEGDMVESRDKAIYVNNRRIDEPYIQHTDASIKPSGEDKRDNFGPIVVPKDHFFVMGDNRDQSLDSRYWGFVSLDEIKGKAFVIYFSWDSSSHLPRISRIAKLVN